MQTYPITEFEDEQGNKFFPEPDLTYEVVTSFVETGIEGKVVITTRLKLRQERPDLAGFEDNEFTNDTSLLSALNDMDDVELGDTIRIAHELSDTLIPLSLFDRLRAGANEATAHRGKDAILI